MDHDSKLTSLEYDENYYDEHKKAGLDYLGYGYWQESYAEMVCEVTCQKDYQEPRFLDAGCACGSILHGFKKTEIFNNVVGIDLSQYMVELGKAHFGFTGQEIITGNISNLPVPGNQISLLHSAQVLEHLDEAIIDKVLAEFYRVVIPGGRLFLCLDAIKKGQRIEVYMNDPTHINIKPIDYWSKKFMKHGFVFDLDSYDRFIRSKKGPAKDVEVSFYHHYPKWTTFILLK